MLDTTLEHRPDEVEPVDRPALRCRVCDLDVADLADLASPDDGPPRRAFFNPAGVMFDVLLLRTARNLVVSGVPSDEFTWFPGRPWQFVHCGGCRRQLGWRWLGESVLYGLVASEIREG